MSDKRWKQIEREYCRGLGAERTGPTGRDDCDCEYEGTLPFGVEIKHGTAAPINKTLQGHMEQCVQNAGKHEGALPLLILHPSYYSLDEGWVCLPWWAFQILKEVFDAGLGD